MTREQLDAVRSSKHALIFQDLLAHIDELTTERDRLRDALQLLYDTSDATQGTSQWEDYKWALRRAEVALKEAGDDS